MLCCSCSCIFQCYCSDLLCWFARGYSEVKTMISAFVVLSRSFIASCFVGEIFHGKCLVRPSSNQSSDSHPVGFHARSARWCLMILQVSGMFPKKHGHVTWAPHSPSPMRVVPRCLQGGHFGKATKCRCGFI